MKSKADELFDKINKMPLKDLLILCSTCLEDERMDAKRRDVLLLILEQRLVKKRIATQVGLTTDDL